MKNCHQIVEEEGIKLVGEAEAAMHDVYNMDYDTIGLSEHIDMLNEDQRRIFDQVADHLMHQSGHDCDDCKCTCSRWNWQIIFD